MREFEIIRKKDMFCYETAFSTICYHYKVPYQLLFSNTWGYDYNGDNRSIGKNIKTGEWDLVDKIKAIGIMEEKVNEINTKNSEYIRYNIICGKLAIAIFDIPKLNEIMGFDYKGSSSPYLIYDYKNEFIAFDLHYTNDVIVIPNELYEKVCKKITFYYRQQEDTFLDFRHSLKDIGKILAHNSPDFKKMEHLAELFNDGCVDLEYETREISKNGNPVYAPLINKVETLSRGRNLFSIYLTYVNSMIPEINLTEISERMAYWAGRWNLIKVILIKAYYKKNFDQSIMKKIATIVFEIVEGEKLLYEQLKNVCIDENKEKDKSVECIGKIYKRDVNPITIDLSSYYNNAGIVLNGSNKKADMTGLGAYIEFESEEINKAILKYNDLYGLLNIVKRPLDNVLCQGQIIDMPMQKYNQLNILGCSDYGSFTDYLTLNYEDDEEKKIFEFSSWTNKQPLFNNKVYCMGQLKELKVRLYQPIGTLFTQSIRLRDKRISSIKLPDCQTIHIFSIYLS